MPNIMIFCIFALLILSCGGSLSDDKREAFKQEMENRKIKKIPEEQIFEKAFETGRSIMSEIKSDTPLIDISTKNHVTIRWVDRESNDLSDLEKKIWEAYSYNGRSINLLNDNIQKMPDTLVYSNPVLERETLKGIWIVNIPKKQIILSL